MTEELGDAQSEERDSTPNEAAARSISPPSEKKRRRRLALTGCGGLFLLFVVTMAVWMRDEAPADLSDLDPQITIEIPPGEVTVVEGITVFFGKMPVIPPRFEDLQIELNMTASLESLAALPTGFLEDPELASALESFRTAGEALLPELRVVLDRPHFGIEPMENFTDAAPFVMESRDLLDFEQAMAMAARQKGDSQAASRAYGRLLEFSRRYQEEGGVTFLYHLVAVGIELAAWNGLESVRQWGPLDPAIEEMWLGRVEATPPAGIDMPETIRQEFRVMRDSIDFIYEATIQEGGGAGFLANFFFKRNRTERLAGEAIRQAVERAELSPAERSQVTWNPPRSTMWGKLLSLNFGETIIDAWLPTHEQIVARTDRARMVREAGRLLFGFDRYQRIHGTLPPDLDALAEAVPELTPFPIDPYSGKRFLYDPKRKLFWSFGEDGGSQGGTEVAERYKGTEPWNLLDPVWPIPELKE